MRSLVFREQGRFEVDFESPMPAVGENDVLMRVRPGAMHGAQREAGLA